MSYIFSLLFILSAKETNKVVLTYESAEKSSSVCLFYCAAQATLFPWFSSAGPPELQGANRRGNWEQDCYTRWFYLKSVDNNL